MKRRTGRLLIGLLYTFVLIVMAMSTLPNLFQKGVFSIFTSVYFITFILRLIEEDNVRQPVDGTKTNGETLRLIEDVNDPVIIEGSRYRMFAETVSEMDECVSNVMTDEEVREVEWGIKRMEAELFETGDVDGLREYKRVIR